MKQTHARTLAHPHLHPRALTPHKINTHPPCNFSFHLNFSDTIKNLMVLNQFNLLKFNTDITIYPPQNNFNVPFGTRIKEDTRQHLGCLKKIIYCVQCRMKHLYSQDFHYCCLMVKVYRAPKYLGQPLHPSMGVQPPLQQWPYLLPLYLAKI